MIVHTMSPTEVVADAVRDLPAVWNKLKDPVARLQRQVKVDPRVRDKERFVEYRSHNSNNWIIVLRATKKVVSIVPYVYYWGSDKKLRAARICDPGISYHFSGHLLEQYFARFNKAAGALERLKEFAVENMDIGTESCDALGELRCGIRHGYLTGVWAVKDTVAQLTTFVDHGKLFPEQIEQMERLDQQRYESAHPGRRHQFGHPSPWAKGSGASPGQGR